jgi:hypothetical protein
MKRLSILAILIIIMLASSCKSNTIREPTETQRPESTSSPAATIESGLPFTASLNTAKTSYLPGEEIKYGEAIVNKSSGTMTIDPFPPAWQIKSVDQNKITISEPAGTGTQDILPTPFYHSMGSWDQKDSNGNQVPSGRYEISFNYVLIEQNTSKKYTADLKYEFQIAAPDSAMNKLLIMNQTVTEEGIAVTLERIELNAVEAKVYLFTVPPGYSLPEGRPPEQSEVLAKSIVEYSVDGSPTKRAKYFEGEFNQSGARLIWSLDPVPLDAKEIVITITKLGDQEGKWEYEVSTTSPTLQSPN